LLLGAGGALRCYRLDIRPSISADRQRTNMNTLYDLMSGGSLFANRGAWMELPILPWLAARTRALATLGGSRSGRWRAFTRRFRYRDRRAGAAGRL